MNCSVDFHGNDEVCVVHGLFGGQKKFTLFLDFSNKSQEQFTSGVKDAAGCVKYDWCYCRTDAGRDKQSAVCVRGQAAVFIWV